MNVFKNCSLKARLASCLLFLLMLSSCSGDDENTGPTGGISGTGFILEGTVQNKRMIANNEIRVKTNGNPVFSASVGSNGRYSLDTSTQSPPYLLQVNFTSGEPFYALTYSRDGRQNVHTYSDLAIRNWYAAQGIEVADVFSGAIDSFPTEEEINGQRNVISSLIDPVLNVYGLLDANLTNADFDANDQGIDNFLDNNPVVIINGDINIIITDPDPDTDFQSSIISQLALDTDLSSQDVTPPDRPEDLRALPSDNSEIVLAWDPSKDDIGVSRYEIQRDGATLDESPFPVYIDSDIQEGIEYNYSVVAIDAAGNRSEPADAVAEIFVDQIPPPAPTEITLDPSETSIRISWLQELIGEVSSFDVFLDSEVLLSTTSTFAFHTDLVPGTEYCYEVVAVDASRNRSTPSSVACYTTTGALGVTSPVDTTATALPQTITPDVTGAWGGIVSGGSGDIPVVVDIESDGDGGFTGTFNYPTLGGCDGTLDLVSVVDDTYEFTERRTSFSTVCPLNARVSLLLNAAGSESILSYEWFNPDNNVRGRTGTLRRRVISSDAIVANWGGIVRGDQGDIPLVIDLEAGPNGTLTGTYNYPTLPGCDGNLNLVAEVDGTYEFFQRRTSFSTVCALNRRVSLTPTNAGSEQTLGFQSYNTNTNQPHLEGTMRKRVISSNAIVADWGGIVRGDLGEIPVVIDLEAGPNGTLTSTYNYPTLAGCDGNLNLVAEVDGTYEFFQRRTSFSTVCALNRRVSLTPMTVGSEQTLRFQSYNTTTNQPHLEGTMGKRIVSSNEVLGTWSGIVGSELGAIQLIINIAAGANDTITGTFDYPTLTGCDGELSLVTQVNNTFEFFLTRTSFSTVCVLNARISLTLANGGPDRALDYIFYSPSTSVESGTGMLRMQ